MAARGTPAAMDQGKRGAVTTAVFSRASASSFLSGVISRQRWYVSMMERT